MNKKTQSNNNTEVVEEERNLDEGVHNFEYESETTLTFRDSNVQGEKLIVIDELDDGNIYGD